MSRSPTPIRDRLPADMPNDEKQVELLILIAEQQEWIWQKLDILIGHAGKTAGMIEGIARRNNG